MNQDLVPFHGSASVTIVCKDGAEIAIHSNAFRPHSDVLASMVKEEYNENGDVVMKIYMPDVDCKVMWAVVNFIYSGNYLDGETIGGFFCPANVISMTWGEVNRRLMTVPCHEGIISMGKDYTSDNDSDYSPWGDDSDYSPLDDDIDCSPSADDIDYSSSEESSSSDDEGNDLDGLSLYDDLATMPADLEENTNDQTPRVHFNNNLKESLRVYNLATLLEIQPLRLLARDRFYRTAEKILLYSPEDELITEEQWDTDDHQRVYRARHIDFAFHDFPFAVDELYETVHPGDTVMRAIPALIIAAGYHKTFFRDNVQFLLDKYPELARSVLEGMRVL